MRVLALIPPDRSGSRPSRYSFLAEELSACAAYGLEVYSVSPHVTERCVVGGVHVLPVPRGMRVQHTARSMRWMKTLPGGFSLVDRLSLVRMLESVEQVLVQERIDVAYSPFGWPAGTAALGPARRANVPVVVSLRGADVLTEERIGYGRTLAPEDREQMRATLSQADHVIGVSSALVERGIELGADPNRCTVVLKGVDHQRFSPGEAEEARRSLGLGDRPTVLFAGHLIPRKGADVLLEAIKIARRRIENVQLIMCGSGPDRAALEELVRRSGLDSTVRFAGQVDRETMPVYFRACDVFVLPSRSEGSGNVLVEAAASGRAAIGTDVAGIPDYIDEGVTGYLFRKGDAGDLAAKLEKVLGDPQHAARLGEAGRKRVEERHRMETVIEQIKSVFEQVIAEHRGERPRSVSEPGTQPVAVEALS